LLGAFMMDGCLLKKLMIHETQNLTGIATKRGIVAEGLKTLVRLKRQEAIKSAENYRKLRQQGITIRKTIDVMIASYCMDHALPLLYSDRDFDPIAQHLGLQSYHG